MEEIFALLGAFIFVILGLIVFMIIVQWKLFEKAGQPGWAAIVPVYNLYVYTQVIKRPQWWLVLYFASVIPVIGSIAVFIVYILDSIELSKVFGKSTGFAVGLILLAPVFQAILAFGDAKYIEDDELEEIEHLVG